MSYKEKIHDFISKREGNIELSKQEVNLNMAKDIISMADKANSDYEKGLKGVFSVLSAIDKAIAYLEPAIKEADKVRKMGKEYQEIAKQLGASIPSDVDKAIQKSYEISKLDGLQTLKDLQSAKSSF